MQNNAERLFAGIWVTFGVLASATFWQLGQDKLAVGFFAVAFGWSLAILYSLEER